MLNRYARATGDRRLYDLIHLSNSSVDPEARSVFRLHHADGDLALKLDLDGAETHRATREYKTLMHLLPAFARSRNATLITPVWCDPDEIGLISTFASGPTALQSAQDDPSSDNLAVLGMKGALFLNVLHAADPVEDIGYGPDWVTQRLTTLGAKTGARAPQIGAAACAELIRTFRRISTAQRGASCQKCLAHGDFHGGNLILSEKTTGLDLTEIRRKLGLYDAVDYLTSLDLQRPDTDGPLTDLGLHPALDTAFCESYRHPLPRDVLRCAMLGKWLILTFKVTRARHEASAFQREKLIRLQARLAHML